MSNSLRRVDLEFSRTAPIRLVFLADLGSPQAAVFDAISADPRNWTWFPGLSEGRYEGPEPHGVGSIRQVRMGDMTYRETILAWDAPHRWAYRVDEASVDIFAALVEDWIVEANDDGSKVMWIFASEPRAGTDVAGMESMIGEVFREAMQSLDGHLRGQGEHRHDSPRVRR